MLKPNAEQPTPDQAGQKYQLDFQAANNARGGVAVVDDGYESGIFVPGTGYLVYEAYHGTDGKTYDRYRPANKFETHLLQKIHGLSKFFVE